MKKNHSGFGIVGIVLVVVVIGVLAGSGYLVWNRQKNNTAESTTTTDTAATGSDYLEITELGLKLKKPSNIPDIYYAIKADSSGNKYAVFSSRSLAELDPGCAADAESSVGVEGTGRIYAYTDPSASDPFTGDYTNAESFPDSVKVDNTYYTIIPQQQSPCYSDLSDDSSETAQKNSALVKFLRNDAVLEKL